MFWREFYISNWSSVQKHWTKNKPKLSILQVLKQNDGDALENNVGPEMFKGPQVLDVYHLTGLGGMTTKFLKLAIDSSERDVGSLKTNALGGLEFNN